MAEISNPNQQGGQDNRSLMAIVVFFMAVLLGVQYFRQKNSPPQPPPKPAAPLAASANPAAPITGEPVPPPSASSPSASTKPVVQAGSESTATVENNLYRIQFSNRGAQVTSWILKGGQFTDDQGKPLDLVSSQAAKLFGYPLSLYTYDGLSVPISSISRNNHVVPYRFRSDSRRPQQSARSHQRRRRCELQRHIYRGSERAGHAHLHAGLRRQRHQQWRHTGHCKRRHRRNARPCSFRPICDGRHKRSCHPDVQVLETETSRLPRPSASIRTPMSCMLRCR